MPNYLHPGVYIEEIPSGSKPIEGVGTSTAAFVGYAVKGRIAEPTLIQKWDDYERIYGGVRDLGKSTQGDPMGLSVAAFFLNGGTKAYIVRVTEDTEKKVLGANHAAKATGYVDHPSETGKKALKFTAANEGAWANGIIIKLQDNELGNGSYDVLVGRESTDSRGNVTFTADESFVGVSLDADHPLYIGNVINARSDLVTVDEVSDVSTLNMVSDQYLGTSTSGDLSDVSLDFSALSPSARKMKITVDTETEKTIALDQKHFTDLPSLAAHIRDKVQKIDAEKECYAKFSCEVLNNKKLVLTSGTRKSISSVKIKHDFGIAPGLKLGVVLYQGSSTSGDLGGGFSLALSNTTTFPDTESRSLQGTVDGNPFTVDLGNSDLAGIADIAAVINGVNGLSCTASGTTLKLVSDTARSTSSVVIQSDFGIAPTLKLGIAPENHGGEELTGQDYHNKSLSKGSSTSGDLGASFSLALSDNALFPDADARSLRGVLDGSPFGPFDLGTDDLADIGAIAGKISEIAGLTCTAVGNKLVLESALTGATSAIVIQSDFGIAEMLKLGVLPENWGGVERTGPQNSELNFRIELTGQEHADSAMPKDRLDNGVDGGKPLLDDYVQVFTRFTKYRDINIICLPGQYWSQDSAGNAVVQAAIGHAEKMKSRMVLVDPPPSYELTNEKMVNDMGLPSQTYCVTYYPWVSAANRFYHAERAPGLPKNVLVPPSGYAAGMWAKIDAKRGVWKAAAGTETGLLGISGLEFQVEDGEQDSLNPWGVNCLRRMPGAGPVIWGARTLATKADPEWRYVPVRRTAMMIEQSIYQGVQWAVFEPNNHILWSALRANIGNFMNGLFRAGAFQGEKASDAYFVRCSLGDTMTQGDIDAGQVIAIVGFAPLKPAEFVIVRIQQKVNQQ